MELLVLFWASPLSEEFLRDLFEHYYDSYPRHKDHRDPSYEFPERFSVHGPPLLLLALATMLPWLGLLFPPLVLDYSVTPILLRFPPLVFWIFHGESFPGLFASSQTRFSRRLSAGHSSYAVTLYRYHMRSTNDVMALTPTRSCLVCFSLICRTMRSVAANGVKQNKGPMM